MNNGFTFPTQRPAQRRPPPTTASGAPAARESSALRASVLDVALELGLGNNQAMASWMFNDSITEEDEREGTPGLISPSTTTSEESSNYHPPPGAGAFHTMYNQNQSSNPNSKGYNDDRFINQSGGGFGLGTSLEAPNLPHMKSTFNSVSTIDANSPLPMGPGRTSSNSTDHSQSNGPVKEDQAVDPPVKPTSQKKLKKARKPGADGGATDYESEGGHISESGKKEKDAKKKKSKASLKDGATTDHESDGGHLSEAGRKKREKEAKKKRKEAKKLEGKEGGGGATDYETDAGYLSESHSKFSIGRSKTKSAKSIKPKNSSPTGEGYETDDPVKKKSRGFFRLKSRSHKPDSEKEKERGGVREREREVEAVPPVPKMPLQLPIADMFARSASPLMMSVDGHNGSVSGHGYGGSTSGHGHGSTEGGSLEDDLGSFESESFEGKPRSGHGHGHGTRTPTGSADEESSQDTRQRHRIVQFGSDSLAPPRHPSSDSNSTFTSPTPPMSASTAPTSLATKRSNGSLAMKPSQSSLKISLPLTSSLSPSSSAGALPYSATPSSSLVVVPPGGNSESSHQQQDNSTIYSTPYRQLSHPPQDHDQGPTKRIPSPLMLGPTDHNPSTNQQQPRWLSPAPSPSAQSYVPITPPHSVPWNDNNFTSNPPRPNATAQQHTHSNTNSDTSIRKTPSRPHLAIVPSSDYVVPSPGGTPLPSPRGMLAKYDIPPPSPPPTGPLPRPPHAPPFPTRSQAGRQPIIAIPPRPQRPMSPPRTQSIRPITPPRAPSQRPFTSPQQLQTQPLNVRSTSPSPIQRGRESPFPQRPILPQSMRPASAVGSEATGVPVGVGGLEARVKIRRYRDLYALPTPNSDPSQRAERRARMQAPGITFQEPSDNEDEDEEFEGRYRIEDEDEALGHAGTSGGLDSLLSRIQSRFKPSSTNWQPQTNHARQPPSNTEDAYDTYRTSAGSDDSVPEPDSATMYMLERAYSNPSDDDNDPRCSEESRYSKYAPSEYSVLDADRSQEVRDRFVESVEAMYAPDGKETGYGGGGRGEVRMGAGRGVGRGIPPVPSLPSGVGKRVQWDNPVGNRF